MQYYGKIEKSKIARRGHSTTDALLFMLQAIYEAVACAFLGARVFFVEFSKGFDLIDYKILMTKLRITGSSCAHKLDCCVPNRHTADCKNRCNIIGLEIPQERCASEN